MNNSGDAAEQIVRFGFEGAEVALKITGAAAKNIAAMLYAVLKDQKRTRGKARLDSMIREGKQTAIYTVKKDDCPNFAKQAKKYGIKYSPIPVKKEDKSVDIMVFEDDAVRANRIVEKFNISAVKSASITNEVEEIRKKQQAGKAPNEQTGKEQSAPEKSAEDQLLDEMLGSPIQKEKGQAEKENLFGEAAGKTPPSANISEYTNKTGSFEPVKPSVREELREITVAQKQKEGTLKAEEKSVSQNKSHQQTITHKQPKPKKKPKTRGR